MDTRWDAIVVGSGIGGLAAAAALGKHGQRVLVLEQHTVPGGQTQTFQRRQWTFATGVHYIGGVGPYDGADGQFGRLLAWLTDGELAFAPMPNPYDIVQWPGFEFGIEHPQNAYRAALHARFGPADGAAIDGWFAACEAARQSAFTLFALHAMPSWLAAGLRWWRGAQAAQWARHTLADELRKIANPQLRAVLGARWGDHGAVPGEAPFVEHALVTGSYDAGAYYPIGGPARFVATLRPAIERAGGELRTGADVSRIVVERGHVAGVEVVHADGRQTQERAAHVISAMGAGNTAARLDAGAVEGLASWRLELSQLAPGTGFVGLFLGFEGDIAAAGASAAQRWIYASEDIGRLWRHPADEDAPALFVSFPSLKDPAHAGGATAEVLAMVDGRAFAPWLAAAEDGAARGEDYVAFKEWVGERLLAQFLRHFPKLQPLLRFHEVATPLSQRRYVRTPDGAMYGLEMTGERLMNPALNLRTPVPGLLLAGQDVMGPGVQASFMGGLMAAATVSPRIWKDMGR
jgi:all-trans-retinol 13,14-reductase